MERNSFVDFISPYCGIDSEDFFDTEHCSLFHQQQSFLSIAVTYVVIFPVTSSRDPFYWELVRLF